MVAGGRALWRWQLQMRSSRCLRVPSRALSTDGAGGIDLDAYEELAARRRSVKRFSDQPLPEGLLKRLLAVAQRAPSGFNLQPWVAVAVTSPEKRAQLLPAALSQPQVETAPAVVVFAGNMRAIDHLPRAWKLGSEAGYYKPEYQEYYHRNIRIMLEPGPCGALQVVKHGLAATYSRARKPFLSIPLSLQGYAWKHTMLAVMNFLNAATASGLSCSPMEGIDEAAVKQVVGLPENFTVPCIVAVGYPHASEADRRRSPRFPSTEVFFENEFGHPLK